MNRSRDLCRNSGHCWGVKAAAARQFIPVFAQGVGRVRAGVAISAGEKNLRAHQHNVVDSVVLSVSWEWPVWSLPLRSERFQHLDNVKKCFLKENK